MIRKRFSCQTDISIEHLPVAVFVFSIVFELETPNLAVFCNIFICIHSTITNALIPHSRPMIFIMLQYTGLGTPVSFDYSVSSFPDIFTRYINKSY